MRLKILPLKSIKILRMRTRQTLRRNTFYRFYDWYEYAEKDLFTLDEEDETVKRQNIKLATKIEKLQTFLYPNSRLARRKGRRSKQRKIDALDGQMHHNLLQKACYEVDTDTSSFEHLWNETWVPTHRYLIRLENAGFWNSGGAYQRIQSNVTFYESDSIEMLGRMYTASMKRKPVHFVNYVDLQKVNLFEWRERVQDSGKNVEDFIISYTTIRKKNLTPTQKCCKYYYRINNYWKRDKGFKEREKQSEKAHRRDMVQSALCGSF